MRSPLRLARLTAQGLVLGVLVSGTTAFGVLDKTVTVSVDGQATKVHTFATSVRGALARAGVRVGQHDVVAPALAASVHDGSQIVVARGRPLDLTIDGVERTIWVTQPNVDAAVQALGLRADNAYLSASRSREIPLSGLSLVVRTPQRIVLVVHGRARVVTTTAPTVAALLVDYGVPLSQHDRITPGLSRYPTSGLRIIIKSITQRTVQRRIPIPFATREHGTDNLYVGDRRLLRAGRPGYRVQIILVEYHNGAVAGKRILRVVVHPPVDEVINVGTKARPKPKPKPRPVPVQRQPSYPSGGSGSGLNWAALAQCESGGDPTLADPPYYGLYQFDLPTWQSVGGSGYPNQASPSEQLYRAKLLYARAGRAPWPVCGKYL